MMRPPRPPRPLRSGHERRVHAVGSLRPAPYRVTCLLVECGCCGRSGKLWREPDPREGGAGTLAACPVCGGQGWREVGR